MNYSVQLYSVRHALAADPDATLARLADIGYQQVEVFDFVSRRAVLESGLAATGLTAPSGHAPLLSGDQEATFDAAAALGLEIVIDPFIPAEHWLDLDSIRRTADGLNAAAALAAGRGLRVGYHNHAWELASIIDGTTALEHLAGLLEPAVLLEVDTYWAAVGGQDPAALLTRLGDQVKLIHLKDGPITADVLEQQPAGMGSMKIWDIIGAATAVEIGVVEFDDYTGDMFDALTASLAYLQRGPSA